MFTVNHWFHRNPLKATAVVSFDHRTSPSSTDAMQICQYVNAHLLCFDDTRRLILIFFRQLRQLRLELLQALCNPMLEPAPVRDLFDRYISFLTGFLSPPDGSSDDSKLRYTTKFYWSDSLTKTDIITYGSFENLRLEKTVSFAIGMFKMPSSKSVA